MISAEGKLDNETQEQFDKRRELYRISQQSPRQQQVESEELKAKKIARNPDFLNILKKQVGRRVVGEENSIHTIILTAAGGLFIKNQSPPTYTLIANSKSNSGKDHITRAVLDLFPKARIEHRTRISERALTYWHNAKFEPNWTWDNKILYLSDVSNAVLNSEVVKCMVTEGSTATIVINHMSVDIKVNGKPCIIGTIANASPAEETLGRFPFMALDESQEQTKAVMNRQASAAVLGKKLSSEYDEEVLSALLLLEPVDVVIPYAPLLPDHFNSKSVIMRRNFDRILKYIAASAALHQLQRERDENGCVIAIPEDYEQAATSLRKIATNNSLVPLTREDRAIIEYALTAGEDGFSVFEVSTAVPLQRTSLYEHLDKLVMYGMLKAESIPQTYGRPKKVYRAASTETYEVRIPTWKEITEGTLSALSALSGCPERTLSPQNTTNNKQPADFNGQSGQPELTDKPDITDKVSVLDKVRELWKGKKEWIGKPLPIESVQTLVSEATDEWFEQAKQKGDIIERPAGWVMPV